jgi:4-hydroxybenzoate polyprenyltransferase
MSSVIIGATEHTTLFLKLFRPEQWTKNMFIFLPVFFSGQLLNVSVLISCAVAFTAFSLTASSIYCFNDIRDVEADKSHPVKCKRPIASGVVSIKTAYTMMAVCLLMSLGILFFWGGGARYTIMALILFYYVMNIAYSLKLKQIATIDVVIISIGFVLRVFVGGAASGIRCSEWIIIMTFLLAMFLALAKRRDDVILCMNTGILHRKNTDRYNLEFMNQVITIVATIAVVAYIMYTLSSYAIERFNNSHFYLTTIFVLTGVVRYLQITIVDMKSDCPTKILLHDRFIQGCIAGWIVSFFIIIYSKKLIAIFRTVNS